MCWFSNVHVSHEHGGAESASTQPHTMEKRIAYAIHLNFQHKIHMIMNCTHYELPISISYLYNTLFSIYVWEACRNMMVFCLWVCVCVCVIPGMQERSQSGVCFCPSRIESVDIAFEHINNEVFPSIQYPSYLRRQSSFHIQIHTLTFCWCCCCWCCCCYSFTASCYFFLFRLKLKIWTGSEEQ